METVFDKPLDTELSRKQNSSDNNLATTAKTVVGAINENTSAITSNSQAIAKIHLAYKAFDTVNEFDSLTSGFIDEVRLETGGTAQGGLPFTSNASLIINGEGSNIHLICTRANGEIYVRSKNQGTWDSSWKKIITDSIINVPIYTNYQGTTTASGNLHTNIPYVSDGKYRQVVSWACYYGDTWDIAHDVVVTPVQYSSSNNVWIGFNVRELASPYNPVTSTYLRISFGYIERT